MSSHHFVREGQEPAIVLLEAIDHGRVAPLLEWAPTIAVHERCLDAVLDWGVKIDIVIAYDGDLQRLHARLASQFPVRIISDNGSSDGCATALHYLVRSRESAACIICGSAEPLFETLLPFAGLLRVSLLTPDKKWSLIAGGKFEKWVAAGTALDVQATGLFRAVNADRARNVVTAKADGIVLLEAAAPFWVGETV